MLVIKSNTNNNNVMVVNMSIFRFYTRLKQKKIVASFRMNEYIAGEINERET